MSAICLLALALQKKKKKVWVKTLFIDRINYCGAKVLNEIDSEEYKNYLRMGNTSFMFFLEKVTPLISKSDTLMRECLCRM